MLLVASGRRPTAAAMGLLKDMKAADVVSLSLSLSAAALSGFVLWSNLRAGDEPSPGAGSAKPTAQEEKKRKQAARCRAIETLIMERGQAGTKDYRVHVLAKDGDEAKTVAELSLWHDVPLAAPGSAGRGSLFNFICEIPKCTRKKFEVATTEGATPIKQDTKKGVLREFKKGDIFFNYGCFPRTWEDPRHTSPDTGYPGDNDPLDVCEIGLRQVRTGEIRAVKVLGVLAMIDDDETDWKVVAIDAEDRWASELNDVDDVERLLPGTVGLIREWFRTYKIPDGKPPNKFAFEERCLPAAYALKVIHETHESYLELIKEGKGHEDLHVPGTGHEHLRHLRRDSSITKTLSQAPVAYDAALPARVSA